MSSPVLGMIVVAVCTSRCKGNAKQFRTEMQQQQNTNEHVSGRKHAGRRRSKHGGQGGGESRHCARVRETRQLRIVGPKELPRRPTCAPRQAPPCGRSVAAPGE